jgi:hypothetical protein
MKAEMMKNEDEDGCRFSGAERVKSEQTSINSSTCFTPTMAGHGMPFFSLSLPF